MTPQQAERLRTEMADQQSHREENAERAGRVASVLQDGGRLDPENFEDREDVARHCKLILKPSLAGLDPSQQAIALRIYVEDTGIAPDDALDSLLGLAVTGEAEGRIAAAHALTDLFHIDPTARDRVPPPLADLAELIGSLAEADTIPPDDIIKVGDGLLRKVVPGAEGDQPDPGLVLLASANADAGAMARGQPADAQPDTAGEDDAASTEVTENTEGDEDDVFFDEEDDSALFSDLSDEDDAADPASDSIPEFPSDNVARLAALADKLTAAAPPARPTGSLSRTSASAADQNVASLDEAKAATSEAEKEFGKLMLSLIPVLGTAIDGKDAFKAFQEAERLEADGKLDEALEKRAEGSFAAVGAIPFIGAIAKFPKAAAQFKRLFRASRVGRLEPGNPRSFSIPRKTDRKIVSQFDQPTCGTASCAMTLTILTGASPDIKDINKAARLTKGGVRLLNIAKVMRNSGVPQARHRLGVSVGELEKAVVGNKPAIVKMNLDRGQHGVVVDGFATRGGRKFVAVLDPAGETANKPGRAYLVPIEEFSKRFTGEVVLTNRNR